MNRSFGSSLPWPLIYDTGLRILTLYNYQEIKRSYYKKIAKKICQENNTTYNSSKKLLVNWNKDVKDFYNEKENCNTVKTEFKEDRRRKDLPCSHPNRINIEKCILLFKQSDLHI